MKQYKVIIIFFVIFLLHCTKDHVRIDTPDFAPNIIIENGFICTGTKKVPGTGSLPWKANAYFKIRKDSMGSNELIIEFQNGKMDSVYIDEIIQIRNLKYKKGTQRIYQEDGTNQPYAGYYRLNKTILEFDHEWAIDTNCVSQIHLPAIYPHGTIQEGTCELYFRHYPKQKTCKYIKYSDQVHFLSLSFRAHGY